MPQRSRLDRQCQYRPPISSPLNPETCYDCPRPLSTKHYGPPAGRGHRPRQASPTLSYAQHILRAKAAEAWRAEHLRRICREAHSPPRAKQQSPPQAGDDGGDEQDVTDSNTGSRNTIIITGPLSRAALDMHRGSSGAATDTASPPQPAAAAVDLEYSLGLDPISPLLLAVAAGGEKPRFGLLQPFTVDMSHVVSSSPQPALPVVRCYPLLLPSGGGDVRPGGGGGGGCRRRRQWGSSLYNVAVLRVLVLVGLLCAAFCLAPGVRYGRAAGFGQRQHQQGVAGPVRDS